MNELVGQTFAQYTSASGLKPFHTKAPYRRALRLLEGLDLPTPTRMEEQDGTIKFCLPAGSHDGMALETESVIIPMVATKGPRWHTLCVSSQIGCRMGCTFCQTGRMGLIRNLTAGEIVMQLLVARKILQERLPADQRVDVAQPGVYTYFCQGIQNIVFMGMGEPLDNFEHVAQAIRVLNDPVGLDFPHPQIALSTVGRIDGLKKLGELNWPHLRIAISLTSARKELRDEIMPVNRAMPLTALKQAMLEYPLHRRGHYMIQYVLIKNLNDTDADLAALAEWVTGLRCIVNIIPYNQQQGDAYETPSEERIVAFVMGLKARGVFTKRRTTHGRDLFGACGQLGNPAIQQRKYVGVTITGTAGLDRGAWLDDSSTGY
jgi:23S rRNA (adenine2503-C2)-methyltransferase